MQQTTYTRLYADDAGESHFEDIDAEMEPIDFAPPAPPLNFKMLGQAHTVGFVGGDPSWKGQVAHPAPNRQLMCIMSGEFSTTVSDGETRSFGIGSILLLDDTTGKGHSTSITSDVPCLVVVVTLEE